ncbi:dolichol-P-glucose synthetase [Verrucomicrobia bacterium LW23]|nr:dolichol-P-glucose synthetase [Verrucomicrobia bacterium LW23]
MELTILMPCLNEAETLEVCIHKAKTWLEQNKVDGEVLIADNGSTDGSQAIAEKAGARVVPVSLKGYGAALGKGIQEAKGRYVIMGDADDSYDFSNLGPFVEKLREGYQLVMGNRFRGGIMPGAMPPLHRYLGNPVLTTIGKAFFKSPCGDFHCGLRGFNREAILALDLRTTGMEFASEMIVKATLNKLRVTEVPTTLKKDGRSRPPHLRSWRDGWRHLRFLLMYSPRWLFLFPGITCMIVGLAMAAVIIAGPVKVGTVSLSLHSLITAAALVLLGYQSILFAIFTKVFAIQHHLLPEDPRLNSMFEYIYLEVGLVVGLVMVAIGIAACSTVYFTWQSHAFGSLNVEETMRVFIPGMTCIIVGVQTIFASFFLSILGLPQR